MNTDIETEVVGDVCARIQDMLLTAVEEEPLDFPALITTIKLLEAYQNRGLELDISIFTDAFMDIIYDEVRTYLSKSRVERGTETDI